VHGVAHIPIGGHSPRCISDNVSSATIRNFQAAKAAANAERDFRAQGAAKLKARFAAVASRHSTILCLLMPLVEPGKRTLSMATLGE